MIAEEEARRRRTLFDQYEEQVLEMNDARALVVAELAAERSRTAELQNDIAGLAAVREHLDSRKRCFSSCRGVEGGLPWWWRVL